MYFCFSKAIHQSFAFSLADRLAGFLVKYALKCMYRNKDKLDIDGFLLREPSALNFCVVSYS
jgi:hypothetical protein